MEPLHSKPAPVLRPPNEPKDTHGYIEEKDDPRIPVPAAQRIPANRRTFDGYIHESPHDRPVYTPSPPPPPPKPLPEALRDARNALDALREWQGTATRLITELDGYRREAKAALKADHRVRATLFGNDAESLLTEHNGKRESNERELRMSLHAALESYGIARTQRRSGLVKRRTEELAHSLDEGETAALGSLIDASRSRHEMYLGDGGLAWLAERCLPVRMYDAEALTLELPAQLEVPQLIGAAHKFLDALDRFLKGENHV